MSSNETPTGAQLPSHDEQVSSEQLLTVEQAAAVAGVATSTIRRWYSAGELPTSERGRRKLMREADVLARAQRDRPAAPGVQPTPSGAPAQSSELALREAVQAMSVLAHDLQQEAAARARAEAIVEQREERLRELRAERDRLAAEVERLGGQAGPPRGGPPTTTTVAPASSPEPRTSALRRLFRRS